MHVRLTRLRFRRGGATCDTDATAVVWKTIVTVPCAAMSTVSYHLAQGRSTWAASYSWSTRAATTWLWLTMQDSGMTGSKQADRCAATRVFNPAGSARREGDRCNGMTMASRTSLDGQGIPFMVRQTQSGCREPCRIVCCTTVHRGCAASDAVLERLSLPDYQSFTCHQNCPQRYLECRRLLHRLFLSHIKRLKPQAY